MPRLVWPFLVSLMACGPQPGLRLSLTDMDLCEFSEPGATVLSGSTFVGEPFKVGVLVSPSGPEYVPAISARLTDLAMDVIQGSTPASSAAFLAAEIAKWEPIIRAAGIRAD